MKFAIVDIETTGSYAAAGGITEISIQVLEAQDVVQRFDALVNPVRQIPPFITALTGITNEMVSDAPQFEEIAPAVFDILKDKIFVAHSVNFDYSFVKSQLQYCGFELNTPRLCTVRLARKIFPGCPSYSLSRLCEHLGIDHQNRHRAGGDTDATVALFKLLIAKDHDGHLQKSLKRTSKERALPPNVPATDFDNLPYSPGVYYFHDEKGKVVYVGKAKNIRYRVSSHFSNNGTSRQRQNFIRYVHRISFEACATELMAAVKESAEIKKLWPKFNAAQKRAENLYGIICYEDQNGYQRLAVDKVAGTGAILATYHHIENAKMAIRQLVREFELCPRLCFITPEQLDEKTHEMICKGACRQKEMPEAYNRRVVLAMNALRDMPSFAIIDGCAFDNRKSCILVWKGKFYGMGFLDNDAAVVSAEQMKDMVTPYKENRTITHMLFSYAKRNPNKVLYLNG